MEKVISLRKYIDQKDEISTIKVPTFCRLMKKVSDAIDNHDGVLININLDDIKINIETGDIIFSDVFLTDNENEKTMASFSTGISLMATRKSTKEHKKVAFTLMFLGWYCNSDSSAVLSDLDVLENFDSYMKQIPEWLQDFFVSVFKNMDYETSFGNYYDKNFTNLIKEKISEAFEPFNPNEEQLKRLSSLVAKNTREAIKDNNLSSSNLKEEVA